MSLFQSNLRKQVRNLPKILNFVKKIHYFSKLFTSLPTRRFWNLYPQTFKIGRFNSVYKVWRSLDPAGEVEEHFLEDVLERSGAPFSKLSANVATHSAACRQILGGNRRGLSTVKDADFSAG